MKILRFLVQFRKLQKLFSVLTHSPQGLSCRALVNPGTKGKEELAKALRLLAAHSLPLGTPSLARYVYLRR